MDHPTTKVNVYEKVKVDDPSDKSVEGNVDMKIYVRIVLRIEEDSRVVLINVHLRRKLRSTDARNSETVAKT